MPKITLRPQPGKQEQFLSSKADIVVYGGAAGGGKTFGLLIESLRHIRVPRYVCTIFRREAAQINKPGGIWDEASNIFPNFKGVPNITEKKWLFPNGHKKEATIAFGSVQHEQDKTKWQGMAICGLFFDEFCHFTQSQFMYLLSRNRSTCGIRPYIRATCNPDSESFVRKLIDWWIGEDGFPLEERSGVCRYFYRNKGEIFWVDNPAQAPAEFSKDCKSFTFIPSKVHDNKILMDKDPGYLSNLKALSYFDRMQLLEGNWNMRPDSGMFFKPEWFEIVDRPPFDPYTISSMRYWDRAATLPLKEGQDPDYTVGLKGAFYGDDFYVLDVVRFRDTPFKVHSAIHNLATQDGGRCIVGLEQEGGSAGISDIEYIKKVIPPGVSTRVEKAIHSKIYNCKPASAAAEQYRIKLVRGAWNAVFLSELNAFPKGSHDDQVDALSGAFNCLSSGSSYSGFSKLIC